VPGRLVAELRWDVSEMAVWHFTQTYSRGSPIQQQSSAHRTAEFLRPGRVSFIRTRQLEMEQRRAEERREENSQRSQLYGADAVFEGSKSPDPLLRSL
jgi:hypothetical protein